MNIILDDIICKADLYPFTLTRSAADIRVGILTIREKWELLLDKKVTTVSEVIENEIKGNERLIPANILPSHSLIKKLKKYKIFDSVTADAVKIEYPWHIFQNNDIAIREDFELITEKRKSKKLSSTNIVTGHDIFIEKGAAVEHSILNTSTGPIYIGRNAVVMEGCHIRGPFAMCEGSILKMGTKVYGATTLGPYCMGGGEIKNAVLFGYSNKAHDGYLGDSVIGEWCNLGAGTSNSNVKNTAGNVKVWNGNIKEYITAGPKCGLIMGDYSRSAINTSFNTGTVVGVASNVFCDGFAPTIIDSFSWGNKKYKLEKALEHIDNWKKLKGHLISEEEKKMLTDIYHQKK
ncbi:MAG TPA: putative sugar nucleotidyl transferase [Chitinophagaceae bacterium]|nr:putative sugar nucleotidyl transferase [Chitinophagaceae bacterium]